MGFDSDSSDGGLDVGDVQDTTEFSDANTSDALESDLYETSDVDAELYTEQESSQWDAELYDSGDAGATDEHDAQASDRGEVADQSLEADERTDQAGQAEVDDIDFSRTMNTQEELDVLRDMEAKGEIEVPEVDPEKPEPEIKAPNLPTEKTGSFEGEPGDSAFTPHSQAALDKMAEYGETSVEYRNGYPDFSPFVNHQSPYGALNCEVEIGHMTADRKNPAWEFGRRPEGAAYDANYDLGNFNQADLALSDQVFEAHPEMIDGKTLEEVKATREEVCRNLAAYRSENGLTWHECADGKTMQLVPTEIHSACRHSGGVSHMKTSMAYGDVTLETG